MMGPNPPDIALLARGESGQILSQSMSDTDDMPRMGLCVLHAEVAGKLQLSERLGPTEAAYAMERCLNRITHCARRHSASRTDVFEDRLIASFPAPAMTLLAAREMLERIRALLPMKGIKLALRAGAVMVRDAEACNEPAEDLARNMAELVSDPDGVLVSSALRDALPAPLLLRLVPVEASPESKPSGSIFRLADTSLPTPAELRPPPRTPRPTLWIGHQGRSWTIDEGHPQLLLGRDPANHIVVDDQFTSRQHARIEWRNNRFYLIDTSTNGTYLLESGGPERFIRGGQQALGEHGHFACGQPAKSADNDIVRYVASPRAGDLPKGALELSPRK